METIRIMKVKSLWMLTAILICGAMTMLTSIVDLNGGSDKTKYNVNDYKPMDVDNSQWMKSLADSRLVADLSLPGLWNDAC